MKQVGNPRLKLRNGIEIPLEWEGKTAKKRKIQTKKEERNKN